MLDVETWNWIQIKIEGAIYEPPELWCHASVLVDQDIIVFSEEKKCPHCSCPIQNYKVSEFKPDGKFKPIQKTLFTTYTQKMKDIFSISVELESENVYLSVPGDLKKGRILLIFCKLALRRISGGVYLVFE